MIPSINVNTAYIMPSARQNRHTRLAFEGDGKKKKKNLGKAAAIAAGTVAITGAALTTPYIKELSRTPLTGNYNPKITKNIGYPDNVQVFASTSQRHYSRGNRPFVQRLEQRYFAGSPEERDQNAQITSVFSKKFMHNLFKKDVRNPFEAFCKTKTDLKKNKDKFLKHSQFPVATPRGSEGLDCWNKDEKNKTRFVFVIAGNEDYHINDINAFSRDIAQIYKIPKANIIKVPDCNRKKLKDKLDSLTQKIETCNGEPEVLFYYRGHGYAKGAYAPFAFSNYFLPEGDDFFDVDAGFDENDLKNYTKNHLKDIKTLIILDACHSGAGIAYHLAPSPSEVKYKEPA